jgi:hypothetical protein
MNKPFGFLGPLFVGLALGACGGESDSDGSSARGEASLAYGDVVDDAEQTCLGLVRLNGCSAALLAPDWVLTAAHCLNGSGTGVRARLSDGQGDVLERWADRYVVPDPKPEGAKGDIGLVHLAGDRPVGWPTEFSRDMDDRPVADLLASELRCYGAGPGSIENGTWAGYGAWRTGAFTVDGVAHFGERDVVTYQRNERGQTTGPGDSGGPCYAEVEGKLVHAGNHSAVGYGLDEAGRIIDSPDMRGYATSTSFYREWIQGVLAQGAYPSMYLRGSMNDWGTLPMETNGNDLWHVDVLLEARAYEYKYDVTGDFLPATNWGDDNLDGKAQASGPNIVYCAPVPGTYRFVFDAVFHTYEVIAPDPAPITVLRIHYDVGWGNHVALRGNVAPLSWSVGRSASWTTGNVWVFATSEIPDGVSFGFKPLRNDRDWSWGANFTAVGGHTVDVYPHF